MSCECEGIAERIEAAVDLLEKVVRFAVFPQRHVTGVVDMTGEEAGEAFKAAVRDPASYIVTAWNGETVRAIPGPIADATTEAVDSLYVEDGFGGMWSRCASECDLEVVRPGKVQCNGSSNVCSNHA